jgi:hypothetical protein
MPLPEPRRILLCVIAFGASTLLATGGSAPVVDLQDGFESSTLLSEIWTSRKFLPGAVEMQARFVRSGRQAVQITLHPGDQMADERGTELERAELLERRSLYLPEGAQAEYAFSMFLPAEFPVVPERLVLAQWKQYCVGHCAIGNPVIALRYQGGELYLSLKTDQEEKKKLFSTTADVRGRWLDFRVVIRFSRGPQGSLRAWMNDKRIVDYEGPTAYSEKYGYPLPGYFYFKMGLYRDHIERPMTVYFDDYSKKTLEPAARP